MGWIQSRTELCSGWLKVTRNLFTSHISGCGAYAQPKRYQVEIPIQAKTCSPNWNLANKTEVPAAIAQYHRTAFLLRPWDLVTNPSHSNIFFSFFINLILLTTDIVLCFSSSINRLQTSFYYRNLCCKIKCKMNLVPTLTIHLSWSDSGKSRNIALVRL